MTRRGYKVIVTLGKEKIDVVVELKREQRTKDDKTLTALQSKVTMFKYPSSQLFVWKTRKSGSVERR